MKDNKLKSITIRVDSGVYETIGEMKWIERKKQSELLRELLEIGLKTKVKEGNVNVNIFLVLPYLSVYMI